MVEYITWLKALAALLITNSHLGHIYPVTSLASGGLLGNLLFFAVSGFCLYTIRKPFLPWYGRRLVRIYPAVWLVTLIAVLTGVYSLDSWQDAVRLFLYPTYYHFIAAILLLYIPFYFVARMAHGREKPVRFLLACGGGVLVAYAACYLLFFDASSYHIDTVEEPMILFSYALAMLMGASFRVRGDNVSSSALSFLLCLVAVPLYCYTKLAVGSGNIAPAYQCVNQVSLWLLCYALLRAGASLNKHLTYAPVFLRQAASFLASVTLEIYLVQYLIFSLPDIAEFVFPLNLFCTLSCIILVAWIAHMLIKRLSRIGHCSSAH